MKNYNHGIYELNLSIKDNEIRTVVGVNKTNGNHKSKFVYDVYIHNDDGIVGFKGDNFSYKLSFSSNEEFNENDLVERVTTHLDKKPL